MKSAYPKDLDDMTDDISGAVRQPKLSKPIEAEGAAKENTDKELYREPGASPGMEYYQPTVHVTKQGLIGMDVGGRVIQMPIRHWHKLAQTSISSAPLEADKELRLAMLEIGRLWFSYEDEKLTLEQNPDPTDSSFWHDSRVKVQTDKLLAWRDKAVKKEKLMRLAAEIREGELKAKLEPFEQFAAHIKAIMEIKE